MEELTFVCLRRLESYAEKKLDLTALLCCVLLFFLVVAFAHRVTRRRWMLLQEPFPNRNGHQYVSVCVISAKKVVKIWLH